MLDAVLDVILALVTFTVGAAVAIPVFVLGIELFYAPLLVSLPVLAVLIVLAVAAYRFVVGRRRVRQAPSPDERM
jgi:hypothetical protein